MDQAPAGAWAQNVSAPVTHSPAVAFLASLPRWGRPRPFALSMGYILPTALSGLLPIIFGVVVSLVLFFALVVRMGPRRKTVDAQLRRVIRHPRRHLWQLPLSALLAYLAVLFVSLGSVAVGVLVNALHDALGALSALLATVARTGFAVVDLFLLFVDRLNTLDMKKVRHVLPAPPGTRPEVIEKAFVAMRDYSVSRIPDVHPLRAQLNKLVTQIADTLDIIDRYASLVYMGMLALLLVQLLAPAAHFIVDVLYAHQLRGRWRFVLYLVYILCPAFTAWLLLGAASGVGPLIADVCTVVHDYRNHLLGLPTAEGRNVLIETGLVCVSGAMSADIKNRMDAAIAPLKRPIAGSVVRVILNSTAENVLEGAEWTAKELSRLLDCKTLIEISGRLEYIVCGNHPHSAAKGIADMWVAFLGLALVLGFAFILSTVGVRTAWSTLVWPFEGITYPRWTVHVDLEKGSEEKKFGEEVERVIASPTLVLDTEPVAITALSLNGTPITSPTDSPRSEGPADDVFDGGAEDEKGLTGHDGADGA